MPTQAVPSSILRLFVIRVKYFVGYLKWVSSFGSFSLCFFLVTFNDYAVKGVNHSGENIL